MNLTAFYPSRRVFEASYYPTRPPKTAMAPGGGAAPTSAPSPTPGGPGRGAGPGARRGAPPAPPATPDPSGRRQGAAGGMRDRQATPPPPPSSSRIGRPRYSAGRGTPPPAAEAPAPPAAPPRPTATGTQNATGQLRRQGQMTGYTGPGPMNPRRATPGAWAQRGRMGGRTTEGADGDADDRGSRRGCGCSKCKRRRVMETAGRMGPLQAKLNSPTGGRKPPSAPATAGRMGPLAGAPTPRKATPQGPPSPSNGPGPYGGRVKAAAPSLGENIAYKKAPKDQRRRPTANVWVQRG